MMNINRLKSRPLKCLLSITLVVFLFETTHAHSPNSAHFSIKEDEGLVKIEAEFPWHLRNAIELFDTTLNKASSSADLKNSLFNYIQTNLTLTGANDDEFELLSVEELKGAGGHSHQSNFILTYSGENLNTIKNRIMFNISKKQVNSHALFLESQNLKFETTPNSDYFTLNIKKQPASHYHAWFVGLFILAALTIGLTLFKKRVKSRQH